jgi:hypothetical protein
MTKESRGKFQAAEKAVQVTTESKNRKLQISKGVPQLRWRLLAARTVYSHATLTSQKSIIKST